MKKYRSLRLEDSNSVPNSYEFEFIDRDDNLKNILITVSMIPGTKKSLMSLMKLNFPNDQDNSK